MCFFFNDTATTEIYTLSLHDALPISTVEAGRIVENAVRDAFDHWLAASPLQANKLLDWVIDRAEERRSEEHTSELQSRQYLVCRLLLEKKKDNTAHHNSL